MVPRRTFNSHGTFKEQFTERLFGQTKNGSSMTSMQIKNPFGTIILKSVGLRWRGGGVQTYDVPHLKLYSSLTHTVLYADRTFLINTRP